MSDLILYTLLWTTICLLWLRYGRSFREDKELYVVTQAGFLLKVVVGCAFLYIYKVFYSASDAYSFLEDSRILHEVFYHSKKDYFLFLTGISNTTEMVQRHLSETTLWSKGPSTLFNDSQNVIRINSLIYFISHGNAYIHGVFMSLFSTIGLRDIAYAFRHRTKLRPRFVLAGLILIPSVLFWTSGILKEPIMLIGIGLVVRGMLADETTLKRAIRIFFGTLILLCIKPYLLVCIGLGGLYFVFSALLFKQRPWIAFAGYIGLLALVLLIVPKLRNEITSSLTVKQEDSYNVGKGGLYVIRDSVKFYYFQHADIPKLKIKDSIAILQEPAHAQEKWIYQRSVFEPVYLTPNQEKWKLYLLLDSSNSLIQTTPINHSFAQLLRNTPEALANALLRPFPTDSGSAFKYPAMVEVFLGVALLLAAIIFRRRLSVSERRLLISMIIFALALLLLVGWTTPVTGAIVRYRIPAYIAIFIISIFVIRTDYLERFTIPATWRKTIP